MYLSKSDNEHIIVKYSVYFDLSNKKNNEHEHNKSKS